MTSVVRYCGTRVGHIQYFRDCPTSFGTVGNYVNCESMSAPYHTRTSNGECRKYSQFTITIKNPPMAFLILLLCRFNCGMAAIIQGARYFQGAAREVVCRQHTRCLGSTGHYIYFSTKSSRKLSEIQQSKCNGQNLIHTNAGGYAPSFQELVDTLSNHSGILAVTGGGGLVGVAAKLYRNAALWKLIESGISDQSILLLPQKPSHVYQSRKSEIREIKNKFKLLRKRNGKGLSVAVYVTGRPGYGKTQLAREFGKEFYRQNKGWFFKNLVVGTLDASSSSTLLQSYITLAIDLGCTSELKALEGLLGRKGELQGLGILSSAVKKELKKRPGWLIVVDNLSSDQETAKAYGSEVLPVLSSSSLPYSTPGINRDSTSPMHASGLATAFGITNHRATWKSFWPQPGDESWGTGYVLITTHDRRVVERSSPFSSELYLQAGMSSEDALALLVKMSGGSGDGALEVVNALDRAPLSVARYVHVYASVSFL